MQDCLIYSLIMLHAGGSLAGDERCYLAVSLVRRGRPLSVVDAFRQGTGNAAVVHVAPVIAIDQRVGIVAVKPRYDRLVPPIHTVFGCAPFARSYLVDQL